MFWRARELAKLALNRVQDFEAGLLRMAGVIDFPVPPHSNMRRTSARSIYRYIYHGLTTYLPIVTMARYHGIAFDKTTKVLDFGCGVGSQLMPLTRHFPDARYFGCDVDPSSVKFMARNYPHVDVYNSPFLPPLKYADGEMDLIYSVSTFSHFDLPTQQKWLAELFRIAKPGGLLLLTTEGWHAVPVILTEFRGDKAEIEETLKRDGFFYKEYWWLKELQTRGPALTPTLEMAKYFGDSYGNTIVTADFVRRHWPESGFEVVGIAEGVINARQDLIVLRRPA